MDVTNEIIIAVMGLTGTGKSSLIKNATGDSSIYVEDRLNSGLRAQVILKETPLMALLGTQDVRAYEVKINGIKYVLVDTPRFDDQVKSDTVFVDKILEWLEASFRAGRHLSGVIYLHSIVEPRMQGSALRNMRMFRKLCGPECYKNVILATTFWDQVSKSTGAAREQELRDKDGFWGLMIKKKSQIVQLGRDKESALKIISLIAQEQKVTLQAQKEIVLLNRSREQTAAAELVNEQARKLELEKKKRLEKERNDARKEMEAEEARKEKAAEKERTALAAKIKEQERQNREEVERQKREETKVRERKLQAKEAAAKAERERVAKKEADIKAKVEAQRWQQWQLPKPLPGSVKHTTSLQTCKYHTFRQM